MLVVPLIVIIIHFLYHLVTLCFYMAEQLWGSEFLLYVIGCYTVYIYTYILYINIYTCPIAGSPDISPTPTVTHHRLGEKRGMGGGGEGGIVAPGVRTPPPSIDLTITPIPLCSFYFDINSLFIVHLLYIEREMATVKKWVLKMWGRHSWVVLQKCTCI